MRRKATEDLEIFVTRDATDHPRSQPIPTSKTIRSLAGFLPALGVCLLISTGVLNAAPAGSSPVLPATGSISGTVTGPGGVPLTGVGVTATNPAQSFSRSILVEVNGTYTIQGLAAGVYFVTAGGGGYPGQVYGGGPCEAEQCSLSSVGSPVLVSEGVTTGHIDFTLVPGGRISGTIKGPNGAPLSGINVYAIDSALSSSTPATTNASGEYAISGLAEGPHFVYVSGEPEYLTQLYDGITCGYWGCPLPSGTPVPVTSGATTGGVNVTLAPKSSVSGIVSGTGGIPIPYVPVFAIDSNDPDNYGFAYTNASGTYTVSGLVPGAYFVLTQGNYSQYLGQVYGGSPCESGYCFRAARSGTPVSVTAGQAVTNINISAVVGGSVSGTVTGIGGAPLSGVQIVSYTAAETTVATTTDANGVYYLTGLAPEPHFITATVAGYTNQLYDGIPWVYSRMGLSGTPVAVTPGATTGNINFAMTPESKISGTVKRSNGTPLPFVTVEVFNAAGGITGVGYTNASGVYTVSSLLPGPHFVRVVNQGDSVQLYDGLVCGSCSVTSGTPVVLVSGATTPNVNFTIPTPTLSSISPSSGAEGFNVTVTLTGTNLVSGMRINAGADITVRNLVAVTPTLATATLSIGPVAALGPRNIIITLFDSTTAPVVFTVLPYPTQPCAGITSEGNIPASSSTFTTIDGSFLSAGQLARIAATGCVGVDVTDGVAAPQGSWRGAAPAGGVLPGQPLDGLICKVGTGNPFFVGKERVFTATESGEVSCMINAKSVFGAAFADNTGMWNVTVDAVGGLEPCSSITPSGNIPAAASWYTGIADSFVSAGRLTLIEATGCVRVDSAGHATPAGSWRGDGAAGAVLPDKPLHGLICRIGDGAPFFVGSSLVFTAPASGSLSCLVNEPSYTTSAFADNDGSWTVSVLDVSGRPDFLVDFGSPYGLWMLNNRNLWTKFHDFPANQLVSADIDGNGKADIIVDFGDTYGIWVYYNHTTWTNIHYLSALHIVAADLDGGGKSDLIIDFGPPYGIWILYNGSTWLNLHGLSARHLAKGELDGNGRAELIIDFGPLYGLWIHYDNNTWTYINALSANRVVATDIDGNGRTDLVLDFAAMGVWILSNGSTWTKFYDSSPRSITAGDLDSDGKADLVFDFGPPFGIWIWNNAVWKKLHDLPAAQITAAQLDGAEGADLVIDFGPPYGIWAFFNNREWEYLHPFSARSWMTDDFDRN